MQVTTAPGVSPWCGQQAGHSCAAAAPAPSGAALCCAQRGGGTRATAGVAHPHSSWAGPPHPLQAHTYTRQADHMFDNMLAYAAGW
jgi:hypothetical protein